MSVSSGLKQGGKLTPAISQMLSPSTQPPTLIWKFPYNLPLVGW